MRWLTIALGICATVFAGTTALQTYRLLKAQDTISALIATVQKAQGKSAKSKAGTSANPSLAGKEGLVTPGNSETADTGPKGADVSGGPAQENNPFTVPHGPVKSVNLDQKRASLKQSLRDNPKNAAAWRQLALIEMQLGNADAELDAYKQWIEAMPDDKSARFLAAEAFARRGRTGEALQYLSDFRTMSVDNPRANAAVANLYGEMNMPDQQAEALRQWVSEAPGSTEAHRALGDYYRQAGQTDQAMAEYQQVAELQPNDAATHIQLGNAFTQMGKTAEALTQFQTAVELSPNDPDALSRLALAQRQSGDLQGALSNYQRVVEQDPASQAGVNATENIQSIQTELAGTQTPSPPPAQP